MSLLADLTTQQKALIGLGAGAVGLYVLTRGSAAGGGAASQLAVVDVRRPTDDANIMGGGGGEGQRNVYNPIINNNPQYAGYPNNWVPVTSPNDPKAKEPVRPVTPTPALGPGVTPPPPAKKRGMGLVASAALTGGIAHARQRIEYLQRGGIQGAEAERLKYHQNRISRIQARLAGR